MWQRCQSEPADRLEEHPLQGLTKIASGVGQLELAERPEPVAGPGMVVLGVRATGICGTDLHIEQGEYGCQPPVTLGHEICGDVATVGSDVDPAWLGRRVVAETYFSTCERCRFCRGGRRNLCAERRSIGSYTDGGFAARVLVPVVNLHPVPDWLEDAPATLAEPLACVCNSLLSPPQVDPGQSVLVTGPGAIGLLAAQVAREAGGDVVVRGMPADHARLAVAAELGLATSTVGVDEPRWSTADRPDVTIECSGSEPAMRDALERTERGGRVVQIGLRGADVSLPVDRICFSELTVTSGNASTPDSWIEAMRLIEGRRVRLEPLISGIGPLERWDDLFARSRRAEGVKFVIDPRDGSAAAPDNHA